MSETIILCQKIGTNANYWVGTKNIYMILLESVVRSWKFAQRCAVVALCFRSLAWHLSTRSLLNNAVNALPHISGGNHVCGCPDGWVYTVVDSVKDLSTKALGTNRHWASVVLSHDSERELLNNWVFCNYRAEHDEQMLWILSSFSWAVPCF